MKTALITWNGRIAPVFDTALEAVIIASGKASATREYLSLPEGNPLNKIVSLVNAGVSTVICGAISNPFRYQATAYGITVRAFISGDIESVIQAVRHNQLNEDAFTMPGCGRRQGRGCGRCYGKRRDNHYR